VDASFFDVQAQPPAGAPPRILCVARVYPIKNQNALIRALDPLAKRRKFELIFLGDVGKAAPYDVEFTRLVAERPWCTHVGFAGRAELKAQLAQANLLALPTLEDNCPMVVLEAMAAGVPVLAARVGGVPDLVTEGETGYLCDPHDAASMCAGAEKALHNPAAAGEIARVAKAQARERFHPRAVAQQHLDIYRHVLASQ
jgi:L-malate glycosyltransferase